MSAAQLIKPEMSADGIERFACGGFGIWFRATGRKRAGFGPAFEKRLVRELRGEHNSDVWVTQQARLGQIQVVLNAAQDLVVDDAFIAQLQDGLPLHDQRLLLQAFVIG